MRFPGCAWGLICSSIAGLRCLVRLILLLWSVELSWFAVSSLGLSAVSPPDLLQTRNGSMKLLQARNDRCSPHNRLMRYTWSRDRATRRSLHPGLKLLQLQCIHHAQLITTSSTNQSKKKKEREIDYETEFIRKKRSSYIIELHRHQVRCILSHGYAWACLQKLL